MSGASDGAVVKMRACQRFFPALENRSIYFCAGTPSLGGATPGVTTFPVPAGGGLIGGGLGAGGIDGGAIGSALVGPVPGLPKVGPAGLLPKVGPAAGELRNCAFAGPATATNAAISMVYLMKSTSMKSPRSTQMFTL
jgi:hypothetical protein